MMVLGRELEFGEVLRLAPSLGRIRALVKTERALAWNPPARSCGYGSVVECLMGLYKSQGSILRTARRKGAGVRKREKQPRLASSCPCVLCPLPAMLLGLQPLGPTAN